MGDELADGDLLRHLLVEVMAVEHHGLQDGQGPLQDGGVHARLVHETRYLKTPAGQRSTEGASQGNRELEEETGVKSTHKDSGTARAHGANEDASGPYHKARCAPHFCNSTVSSLYRGTASKNDCLVFPGLFCIPAFGANTSTHTTVHVHLRGTGSGTPSDETHGA